MHPADAEPPPEASVRPSPAPKAVRRREAQARGTRSPPEPRAAVTRRDDPSMARRARTPPCRSRTPPVSGAGEGRSEAVDQRCRAITAQGAWGEAPSDRRRTGRAPLTGTTAPAKLRQRARLSGSRPPDFPDSTEKKGHRAIMRSQVIAQRTNLGENVVSHVISLGRRRRKHGRRDRWSRNLCGRLSQTDTLAHDRQPFRRGNSC